MPDFPPVPILDAASSGCLSTTTTLLGLQSVVPASTAWPAANLAIFVPIIVPYPVIVYKLVIGTGATAAGNFDAGIYDSAGNRLVSSGATAKPSSSEVVLDITDTQIGPGVYYLALAANGTDNYALITPSGTTPVPLQKTRLYGVMQMATAYTLPNPATFAAATNAVFPPIAAYLRPY